MTRSRTSADSLEFWTTSMGFPTTSAKAATRAEADGWDGMLVPDSQNLTGDPYVALALAAQATSRIGLGTGVTNPMTRIPAVTASSIATVQEESGGRAVLGIGRGDSALAHIGLAPVPVAQFEHYVRQVQTYLRGEDVPFEEPAPEQTGRVPLDRLKLGSAPSASRLRWLRYGRQHKVPVYVAASGPRVISTAAVVADGIILAVGTDIGRLKWAVSLARHARTDAGLDPDALHLGAMVPIAVNSDAEVARASIRGSLATYARFSVMHGRSQGPTDGAQDESLRRLHGVYDMNTHARIGPQTAAVSDEIVESFSIAGPASYCVDRLAEIAELGITRIHCSFGRPVNLKDDYANERRKSRDALMSVVAPALRGRRSDARSGDRTPRVRTASNGKDA